MAAPDLARAQHGAAGWKVLAATAQTFGFATLAAAGVTRVSVEATGGYERGVVSHLRDRGIAVALLQPAAPQQGGRLGESRREPQRR